MLRFFQDLNKYKGYMLYSAKAQLKAELANSWLGGLWWVLEPMLFMLVYMFVYTVAFQRTTTYVVAFIVVGLTYWRFFNSCVLSSITLLRRYRAVISKVYIPKFVLVCSLMLSNAFKMLCSYVPLVILMIYYQVPLSWNIFAIIPITVLLFLLTFGVSCWCMHIGVYVEDLNKLMTIILQLVFYISGVFYPIQELLKASLANKLFAFNPIAMLLHEARNALLYAQSCHWHLIVIYAAVAVAISALAVWVIYRSERKYIKIL